MPLHTCLWTNKFQLKVKICPNIVQLPALLPQCYNPQGLQNIELRNFALALNKISTKVLFHRFLNALQLIIANSKNDLNMYLGYTVSSIKFNCILAAFKIQSTRTKNPVVQNV